MIFFRQVAKGPKENLGKSTNQDISWAKVDIQENPTRFGQVHTHQLMCSKQEGVLEATYEISTMIRLDDNSWTHQGQEVRQLVLQPHLESKATIDKKNYCVGNQKGRT